MTSSAITVIYGMVLHVAGLAAVTVLWATGHMSESVGAGLLGGLLGIGVGAGLTLLPTNQAAPTPNTPVTTGQAVN